MKNKKTLKIIALITSGMLLFAATLLSGCGSGHDNMAVSVMNETTSQTAAGLSEIVINGTVESITSRNVYSTLGQAVSRVHVEVGDRVTAGQTLAELDTDVLRLTIEQQSAHLEQVRQNSEDAYRNLRNNSNAHVLNARAALSATEINLTEARRGLNNALRDFNEGNVTQILAAETEFNLARIELETTETAHESVRVLFEAGAVSQNDLRQSENALAFSRARYETASSNYETSATFLQRNLEQLEALYQSAADSHRLAQEMLSAANSAVSQEAEMLSSSVETTEISLQILERQLEDSTITAPVSGVVTAVFATEGSIGSGLLFVVEDTDNLVINARIREYDLSRIEEGMEVTITSDATGSAVHTGIITRINPAAVLASPIVEFEVEVSVTSNNANLRIGMNARVHIAMV